MLHRNISAMQLDSILLHISRLWPFTYNFLVWVSWCISLLLTQQKYTLGKIQCWFQLLNIQLMNELCKSQSSINNGAESLHWERFNECWSAAMTVQIMIDLCYLRVNQNQMEAVQKRTSDNHFSGQRSKVECYFTEKLQAVQRVWGRNFKMRDCFEFMAGIHICWSCGEAK